MDFILNVKELSVLLVKDANERFSDKNKNITQFNNIKSEFNKQIYN